MKNKLIVPTFNFLKEVGLKGKASRGRNKLLNRLEEKNKELQDDANEIRKDYFETDEEGHLKIDGQEYIFLDNVDAEDKKILAERLLDLEDEHFEVSFTEYSEKYEALFKALDNLDEELSNETAVAYDELLTAYEENEKENE